MSNLDLIKYIREAVQAGLNKEEIKQITSYLTKPLVF